MSSQQIRQQFLDYFQKKQHEIVHSSSLVPTNDPTLLFTNAGMVQFKDVFLGKEDRPYKRATSAQRCVRAGGKHNDLENVGYTARHHTFFEMLGNFSFGDYFKRDAIHYAWEFLVPVMQLSPERLWITVFNEDKEAEKIWLEDIKIDPQRFSRCGENDNFWAMGPTGPCGPCTEIFYDHGPEIAGGPPGSPDANGDRYIEIWNLVFMQYDRAADGSLTPLPKPSVDTGMGLERITAVMQNVHNNYDTDLFQPLIQAVMRLIPSTPDKNAIFSCRVIADHIRSCSFLIADGVIPSNEGRGYVLRRIIRRALRHGDKLGIPSPFFYTLVTHLIAIMGQAYPELRQSQSHIEHTLRQEEEQFSVTLSQGLKLFEQVISELPGTVIPGEAIFKLYDTYGFPVDLTADIARERGLLLDEEGFETAMSKQRDRSRQASTFATEYIIADHAHPPTVFTGYELTDSIFSAKILGLTRDNQAVEHLQTGETGVVILDHTPFYAEGGGQVGDQGLLRIQNQAQFRITDTIKQGQIHLHLGQVEKGILHLGDQVIAEVDKQRRAATVLNHSATHILHRVLHQVLGPHAMQKGSLVEPERLRFDFSHPAPVTPDELHTIEHRVNAEIRANYTAIVRITTPDEALASGAIGLFEEKYGDQVRVVQFGESIELCGGTHSERTGDIGIFKITAETGVAAGIRRIEAVTGDYALQWLEQQESNHQHKLQLADEKNRLLEKQIAQLKDKVAQLLGHDLAAQAQSVHGIHVLAKRIDELEGKALRNTVDQLKQKLKNAVIVLATVRENKISIVAGVTTNNTEKIKANELLRIITTQVGGKGGGREDLAEGGGSQPQALENALQSVYDFVRKRT
ncbi:MAG: alanine--tRNA ligase [Gammaproteobacteria bacterium RIFCSPHIGHO2_12_FULL_41_20]|nr:MAG: alanine--tRNA ligase [Gammaproteobacteria bacterium RIFCSPHIGHO2_12_FULL_41_20]